MTKDQVINWRNNYVTTWGKGKARPIGWHWKTDPGTIEKILYCGTQVVREKDCNLTNKENDHGTHTL